MLNGEKNDPVKNKLLYIELVDSNACIVLVL